MRSTEVSKAPGVKVRLPADPWSNHGCPSVHHHREEWPPLLLSGPEQGFQRCLETTGADLGFGPPVCWVRQTGCVTAEPAPLGGLNRALAAEAASVRGAAYVPTSWSGSASRGPGRGRIRCMEIGASACLTLIKISGPALTPARRQDDPAPPTYPARPRDARVRSA